MVIARLRGRRKRDKGQMRILETVIAAAIIYVVFSASFFLIRSSETVTSQEIVDLNKLGYNLLHRIIESGTIEETLESGSETGGGTDYLKVVVHRFLPTGVFFNLTVYRCSQNLSEPPFEQSWTISNAQSEDLMKLKEIAHASTVYTSKTGNIYYLVLNIARAGQG